MPANMHCTRRLSRLSQREILCAPERWWEAPSWGTEHLRSHPGPTSPTLALPLPLLTGCFAPMHPCPSCDGSSQEIKPCRQKRSIPAEEETAGFLRAQVLPHHHLPLVLNLLPYRSSYGSVICCLISLPFIKSYQISRHSGQPHRSGL